MGKQANNLKKLRKVMKMQTLYVSRPVLNWEEIAAWAGDQGVKSTLGDDMHVTIMFSRSELDVDDIEPLSGKLSSTGGDRTLKTLGDQGALVLAFEEAALEERWQEFLDMGALWDWSGYTAHITITYNSEGLDLADIQPYMGKILLGSERHKPVNENWVDDVKETPTKMEKRFTTSQICKVDKKHGLVFGYGIVCKVDGEDYFDLQDQHITEEAMLDALLDFAVNVNMAKDMHGHGDHGHDRIGGFPFLFPMTTDVAKSLDINIKKSGALVVLKPEKADVLAKFESGEYTGFSIGGRAFDIEEVE